MIFFDAMQSQVNYVVDVDRLNPTPAAPVDPSGVLKNKSPRSDASETEQNWITGFHLNN
jgi:hypothetical protein